MNKFNVELLKGIDNINFGDSREIVERHFSGKLLDYKKNVFSKSETTDYGDFQIYYDENEKFEAIEIFENTKVYIGDVLIFPGNIHSAEKIINDLEPDGDCESGYYISRSKSIGIYAPDEEIECILFGGSDYYNKRLI